MTSSEPEQFFNLYEHGFIRVAVCIRCVYPQMRPGYWVSSQIRGDNLLVAETTVAIPILIPDQSICKTFWGRA